MNSFMDLSENFRMATMSGMDSPSGMALPAMSNGSSSTASPTSQVSFTLVDPHSPVKNEEKPKRIYKRFRNSFIYFVNDRRKRRTEDELAIGHREFISRMGEEWKQLNEDDKRPFVVMAEEDRKRYEDDVKKYGKIPPNPPKEQSHQHHNHLHPGHLHHHHQLQQQQQQQQHHHHHHAMVPHHQHHRHPHGHHPGHLHPHGHHGGHGAAGPNSSPETGVEGQDFMMDSSLAQNHVQSFPMYNGMNPMVSLPGYGVPGANSYLKMMSAHGLPLVGNIPRAAVSGMARATYSSDMPSSNYHYRPTMTANVPNPNVSAGTAHPHAHAHNAQTAQTAHGHGHAPTGLTGWSYGSPAQVFDMQAENNAQRQVVNGAATSGAVSYPSGSVGTDLFHKAQNYDRAQESLSASMQSAMYSQFPLQQNGSTGPNFSQESDTRRGATTSAQDLYNTQMNYRAPHQLTSSDDTIHRSAHANNHNQASANFFTQMDSIGYHNAASQMVPKQENGTNGNQAHEDLDNQLDVIMQSSIPTL
ncbi:hypothetical protein H4R33_000630 [Dimargaris cristalligena]|nr:hypothetical protein H4R33_000630 [Dimargaris cristalligena]